MGRYWFDVFAELAEDCLVEYLEGATENEIELFRRGVRERLSQEVPQEYLDALKMVNGFEAETGIFLAIDSEFLEDNEDDFFIEGFIACNKDADRDEYHLLCIAQTEESRYIYDADDGIYKRMNGCSGEEEERFDSFDEMMSHFTEGIIDERISRERQEEPFIMLSLVSEEEVLQAEEELGCSFPEELRRFYLEKGCGSVFINKDYKFRVMSPTEVKERVLKWRKEGYNDFPDQMPFFMIGDDMEFHTISNRDGAVCSGELRYADSIASHFEKLKEDPEYYREIRRQYWTEMRIREEEKREDDLFNWAASAGSAFSEICRTVLKGKIKKIDKVCMYYSIDKMKLEDFFFVSNEGKTIRKEKLWLFGKEEKIIVLTAKLEREVRGTKSAFENHILNPIGMMISYDVKEKTVGYDGFVEHRQFTPQQNFEAWIKNYRRPYFETWIKNFKKL